MTTLDKHGHPLAIGSYVFDGEGAARIYAIESANAVTLLVEPVGRGANYHDRRRRAIDPATLEFVDAALIDWPHRRALAFSPDLLEVEDLEDAA